MKLKKEHKNFLMIIADIVWKYRKTGVPLDYIYAVVEDRMNRRLVDELIAHLEKLGFVKTVGDKLYPGEEANKHVQ